MKTNPLHALMDPSFIAIHGTGRNSMKTGAVQALSIMKDGDKGKKISFTPVKKR